MVTKLLKLLRVAVAALVLAGFTAGTARADEDPTPAKKTSSDTAPAGDSDTGVLVIVGTVASLILLAWLFSKVSDSQKPSDGTMP